MSKKVHNGVAHTCSRRHLASFNLQLPGNGRARKTIESLIVPCGETVFFPCQDRDFLLEGYGIVWQGVEPRSRKSSSYALTTGHRTGNG